MNKKYLLLIVLSVIIGICISFFCFNGFKKVSFEDAVKMTDKQSDTPRMFSVILSEQEKSLLLENIKNSKNYLEFGSGGSTFLALLNSDANVVSVENDKKWIKHLKEWKIIQNNKRLNFYYANTGKISSYGWPKNPETDRHLFPQYSANVFRDTGNNNYDLVFIDGRFRVACALQTILNTDNDVKIIIHDYTNRPWYHEIQKFLTIEKTADTMVLLRKKPNIDNKSVEEMYEKYKYDCR